MPDQVDSGDATRKGVVTTENDERQAEIDERRRQAEIDERRRQASRNLAWAKISMDVLRIVVWPALIGFVVLSVLKAIEQHPRRQARATADVAHLTSDEQRRRLDEDVAIVQRHRNDAVPAADSAGFRSVESSPVDIREQVLLSEDLVMRTLGAQHGVAVRRQVTFGGRPDLQFDGVFEDHRSVTLVEVEYVIDDGDLGEIVGAAMALFDKAGLVMSADRASFLLVLVADMPEDRRNSMTLQAAGLVGIGGCRHRVCVYGFDQLCGQFGVKSEL